MKPFKEHILEKLKVTKFSGTGIVTYQEYYDLLDEYCKATGENFLDLNIVFDFDDDLLPTCEYNKKPIITLRPAYPHDPEIIIKTYDFSLQKPFYKISS